jgi:hypothetical protein
VGHFKAILLRHPASGHCLYNGRHIGRRPVSVTAAFYNRPLSAVYNGRRPLSVTAAARFL